MTIELIVLTIENELQILKLISFELEELNQSRLLTLKKINSKLLFWLRLKQNFWKNFWNKIFTKLKIDL